jgi:hypothetical protein
MNKQISALPMTEMLFSNKISDDLFDFIRGPVGSRKPTEGVLVAGIGRQLQGIVRRLGRIMQLPDDPHPQRVPEIM